MSYSTSFSKNPTDGSIFLPDANNSSLVLRFEIVKPNNCGDPNTLRKTKIEIIRSTQLPDGSFDENVVSEGEMTINPMCPGSDPKIEISSAQVTFSCSYFGSKGTTSSALKARKKGPFYYNNLFANFGEVQ